MTDTRQRVFDLLDKEREAQQLKHGAKNTKIRAMDHKPLTLAMEELGEAAQTLDNYDNEDDPDLRRALLLHYLEETKQFTALGIQSMERIIEEYGL